MPAAILLVIAWTLLRKSPYSDVAASIRNGAFAGAVATIALEAVRYSGFRLGFMPGNLPELMGVLLFDRFALGPTTTSTLARFAYRFWNGACFGIVFAIGRFGLPNRWAIPYGIAVGVGFLVSPVAQGLGVGLFGVDFGWHFAATVLTAHAAFGNAVQLPLIRTAISIAINRPRVWSCWHPPRHTSAFLNAVYLRGLAHLRLKRGAEAAAELHKIVEPKGANWASAWRLPLLGTVLFALLSGRGARLRSRG